MIPPGALTEEQRLFLSHKSRASEYKWVGRRGYYAVMCASGDLIVGGSVGYLKTMYQIHTFSFDWTPPMAYYFENYFHALAYSLRLKAKQKEETKCSK